MPAKANASRRQNGEAQFQNLSDPTSTNANGQAECDQDAECLVLCALLTELVHVEDLATLTGGHFSVTWAADAYDAICDGADLYGVRAHLVGCGHPSTALEDFGYLVERCAPMVTAAEVVLAAGRIVAFARRRGVKA